MKENDDVNNPKHYQLFPDQQAIDVIQAALTAEEFAGYCKGNALKYRLRAGSKGDALKCIAKANWYQNKLREAKRDSEEETGLQAELERERERRLQFGDPDKPLTVDEYLAGLALDKGGEK